MGSMKFRLVPQRRAAHFAFSEQGKTGPKAERKPAVLPALRQPQGGPQLRDHAIEVGALEVKPRDFREL